MEGRVRSTILRHAVIRRVITIPALLLLAALTAVVVPVIALFTAPVTATRDGLGVDGKGAHTHYEQMYISSIEPRARLLYRLYQTLT